MKSLKLILILAAILLIFYPVWKYIIKKSESKIKNSNVILIIVDTLRADHLSCYGYERNTSPNLDNFSSDSIRFKNAISPSSWTTPAIGSIFTSIYPTIIGYVNEPNVMDESFNTMAEIFRLNGYITGGIISHAFIAKKLGFDQGFDYYNQENNKGHNHISSQSVTELAISCLNEFKEEKFFLFLHYFDPHNNYYMHDEFEYFPEYTGWVKSGQEVNSIRINKKNLDKDDKEYLKALYDSEISFTDHYIGKVLEKLKELELYEDALIIFTADHGEELAEKEDKWIGHAKKLSQTLIHVPLIIKLPGNKKKLIVDDYVGTIDILPTVVDFLDIKIPDGLEFYGEIIDLKKGKRRQNKPIFSETFHGVEIISVVWDGLKLIHKLDKGSNEFYDLSIDPNEDNNVGKKEKEKLREYKSILRKWWSSVVAQSQELNLQKKYPEYDPETIENLKAMGYIK